MCRLCSLGKVPLDRAILYLKVSREHTINILSLSDAVLTFAMLSEVS